MAPVGIEILGRRIGQGEPCFVIAEAGVNHNGDPVLARRLVDVARTAGADAVKFQTWITEKLVSPDAELADYQKHNVGEHVTQFEMLKKLELSQADFRAIQSYTRTGGPLFLSTPDEEDSSDFLEALDVPLFKIGSGEITNIPFLRHVAIKGRPIILSTGMSSLSEVEGAVRAIEDAGNQQLCLLHCLSEYPAYPKDCNLRAIDTLHRAFGYPVGFSDHTLGFEVALAAVALGACVVEKHFTLDTAMVGPDHRASLGPDQLASMIRAIRSVEASLGDGVKRPTAAESLTRRLVQRSIVAARDLPTGHTLLEADLTLRRASGGLPISCLRFVVNRQTASAVKKGSPLEWGMLR